LNFITEYWQIVVAIVMMVMAFARLEISVEVLKEKVKTLFDLWNNKEKN